MKKYGVRVFMAAAIMVMGIMLLCSCGKKEQEYTYELPDGWALDTSYEMDEDSIMMDEKRFKDTESGRTFMLYVEKYYEGIEVEAETMRGYTDDVDTFRVGTKKAHISSFDGGLVYYADLATNNHMFTLETNGDETGYTEDDAKNMKMFMKSIKD